MSTTNLLLCMCFVCVCNVSLCVSMCSYVHLRTTIEQCNRHIRRCNAKRSENQRLWDDYCTILSKGGHSLQQSTRCTLCRSGGYSPAEQQLFAYIHCVKSRQNSATAFAICFPPIRWFKSAVFIFIFFSPMVPFTSAQLSH